MSTKAKPIQQDFIRPRHQKPPRPKKKKVPRRRPRPDEIVAFFGEGVECKGKMTSHGTVRVDGTCEGEIHIKGTLIVGNHGDISAKIRAGSVVSEGRITGDILAKDKVKLFKTAYVDAALSTPQLFIEEGATLLTPWTLKMKRSRISARHIDPNELKIVESQGVDQEHLLKT